MTTSMVRYMTPTPNQGVGVGFITPGSSLISQLASASPQLPSASPNSTDILFIMTGFLITNGVNDGVGVYAMGLHGCLCNAGFYCLRGQCVPTPAGPLACRYAAAPAPHPALHSSYAAERPPHCLAY